MLVMSTLSKPCVCQSEMWGRAYDSETPLTPTSLPPTASVFLTTRRAL